MKIDLVVLGHLMEEVIIFPDHIIGPMIGGVSAYFSVVASCLGSKVGIVSKVGKEMPKKLLAPICHTGVDIQGVSIEGTKSRIAELYYAKDGSKKMKHPYKGKPIVFEDIPINYLQADILYIAPQDWEFDIKEIDKLSQLYKGKMMVELGGYGGTHCSSHLSTEKSGALLRKLLPYFHIAKLSIEDCKSLFKEKDERVIAKKLIKCGVDVSIVTLSEKGAIIATPNDIFLIPALTEHPLDCTGAGDAFAAGFLVSYRKNKDLKRAGLFASATAAIMIEREGGMHLSRMPNLLEVEERLKNWVET